MDFFQVRVIIYMVLLIGCSLGSIVATRKGVTLPFYGWWLIILVPCNLWLIGTGMISVR